MNIAMLFPGQGSQHVGMGEDLYLRVPEARHVFDQADRLLGWSVTEYCQGKYDDAARSKAALTQTSVCQPALYTHAAAVLAALDLSPSVVAGHSVGEYSALYASGAISFADGLRIVRQRGELMANAGSDRPGAMAAVLGMDFGAVEAVCDELSNNGQVCVCANYNSLGQVVISGDTEAVGQAAVPLKANGARRVVPLDVSGAFHSPLMEPARARLAEALEALDIQKARCPVYLNVSAEPTQAPETIRSGLLAQLTSPVRWAQTLQSMPSEVSFCEIGPGRVLSGLVKRTLGRSATVQSIGTADQVLKARQSNGA